MYARVMSIVFVCIKLDLFIRDRVTFNSLSCSIAASLALHADQ